jgi:hypothetical protein
MQMRVSVWMESEQAAVRLLFAHTADGGRKRNQAGGAKAAHPRRPSISLAHALADSWRSTIFRWNFLPQHPAYLPALLEYGICSNSNCHFTDLDLFTVRQKSLKFVKFSINL